MAAAAKPNFIIDSTGWPLPTRHNVSLALTWWGLEFYLSPKGELQVIGTGASDDEEGNPMTTAGYNRIRFSLEDSFNLFMVPDKLIAILHDIAHYHKRTKLQSQSLPSQITLPKAGELLN